MSGPRMSVSGSPDKSPWWKTCGECGGMNIQLDRWAFWRRARFCRCRDCGRYCTYCGTRDGVRFNLRLGWISRLLEPDQSWCGRCKTAWEFVESHITNYTDGSGCFPLCERCWQELGTPAARLPYYRHLFAEWERQGCTDRDWSVIQQAVEAGL